MSRSSTRATLDQPRTRIHRGCSRTSAWVDGFWHGERVSVQLGDRETRVASTFTLSPSISLVLSLLCPPFPVSYSLSLSSCATTVGSTQAGSQCVVSFRVVVTLLSLSLSFSHFPRLSRWRPQHRDATTRSVDYPIPGKTPPLIFLRYIPANLAIDNDRDIRKQVSFFTHRYFESVSFDLPKRRKGANSYINYKR